MPQVAPAAIKERAARLREAGAIAFARRLEREVAGATWGIRAAGVPGRGE
jgi:threonylcarbamoyladenosine tRNA methylthiotransferase MtaB